VRYDTLAKYAITAAAAVTLAGSLLTRIAWVEAGKKSAVASNPHRPSS
jgi:hypothetical protein